MDTALETIERTGDLMHRQGTTNVLASIATVILIAVVCVLIVYIKDRMRQAEEQNKMAQENAEEMRKLILNVIEDYRAWQRQRVDKLDGINDKMIEVIILNNERLIDIEKVLATNGVNSRENFKDVRQQFDIINAKLDDLYSICSEEPMKDCLYEIKNELMKLTTEIRASQND